MRARRLQTRHQACSATHTAAQSAQRTVKAIVGKHGGTLRPTNRESHRRHRLEGPRGARRLPPEMVGEGKGPDHTHTHTHTHTHPHLPLVHTHHLATRARARPMRGRSGRPHLSRPTTSTTASLAAAASLKDERSAPTQTVQRRPNSQLATRGSWLFDNRFRWLALLVPRAHVRPRGGGSAADKTTEPFCPRKNTHGPACCPIADERKLPLFDWRRQRGCRSRLCLGCKVERRSH